MKRERGERGRMRKEREKGFPTQGLQQRCSFPSISLFHGLEIPALHKEAKFNPAPLQAREAPLANIHTRGTFVSEAFREQSNCCGHAALFLKTQVQCVTCCRLGGNLNSCSLSISFLALVHSLTHWIESLSL